MNNDPLNDPSKLDYWMFYYDERYVKETPIEYATKMRDRYLRSRQLSAEGSELLRVNWDTSRPFTPTQARDEVFRARMHVSSLGKAIPADDPVYDPTRLEYYMFEHNPQISNQGINSYAISHRNEYLKVHGVPVPYEESILTVKETGETVPAPNYKEEYSRTEKEPGQSHLPNTGRDKDGYLKDKSGTGWFISFLIAFTLGLIIYSVFNR
ncbi:MAG: hypothetical protein II730_02155 [Bacteroidales bacterium]|nr:hypothetical protein [Bacteroidales bacterium]